jgi:hypothetical protein
MRSIWNVQYMQRVLAADPIAYWMQDEKQGGVSYDMVTARIDGARNGAYTGVTLGQPGIRDGRTSPLFDGANDYNDVLTASLTAAFDGTEGSLMIWARVSGAGVWADGAERRYIAFEGVGDFILFRKDVAANSMLLIYNDSVGAKSQAIATSTLDWFNIMMTWSQTANQTIYYFDGVQQGAIDACAGWGVGLTVRAVIGAGNTIPSVVWDGYLAHVAVWDRPLAPAEIASLAVV